LNSIPRPCGEQIRKKAFSGLLLSQYLPRNDNAFSVVSSLVKQEFSA